KALPESERKCYEFFAACRNQTPPLGSDGPQIHFHFGHVPSLFAASGQDSVEATFMQGSLPKKYTLRAVVTGIGREAVIDDRIEYRSGWSTGNGGNLRLAQQSVAETTQKITEHFKRGDFHGRTPVLPPEPRHWQLGSPIGNEEQKRILNALEDGMSIRTLKDFHEARRYIRPVQTPDPVEIKVPEVKVELPKPAETSGVDPESVTVFANGETTPRRLKPADGETLLTLLQALDQSEGKKIAPPHSCGGAGICADCVVEVKEQPKSAEAPLKTEEKVLEVSGWKPGTHRLACAIHNPRGMTVQYPPKKNGSRGYSQTALLFGEKPAAQGAEKALECER
ncbi:MAG: hypothetical protein EBX40_01920, partial [Gammaproteobacteria bacterium]|nr:hypothetical protein [Gammaproteobacteria bacterium]